MKPTRYRLSKIAHAGRLYELGGVPVNRGAASVLRTTSAPVRGWVMGTSDSKYAGSASQKREEIDRAWASGNLPALAIEMSKMRK